LSHDGVRLIWDSKTNQINSTADSISHQLIELVNPAPASCSDSMLDLVTPSVRPVSAQPFQGRIFFGDNLQTMEYLLQQGYGSRFDLIYIDPPYLSSSAYTSRVKIKDTEEEWQSISRPVFLDPGFKEIDAYLDHIYPRLIMMKELLSQQGSLFVHLDWHISHYVKILLDEIFSPQQFINEIVWCYGGGSGTKRHFHRKHDVILWYGSSSEYIFNPQYRPYTVGTLERGLTKVKGDKYRLHAEGALMQDWWTDINKILSPTAAENLKFPTQKPEALLKRIILSASRPGSLVGDFYAGSGTMACISQESDRNWIACDNSPIAIQTTLERLIRQNGNPFSLEQTALPDRESTQGSLQIKTPVIQPYTQTSALMLLGLEDYKPLGQHLGHLRGNPGFKSLIDFWEVDLDYDGHTFCSVLQVLRDKKRYDHNIRDSIKLQVPLQDVYNLAIKVYDVFGGSQVQSLQIAGIKP